MTTKSTREEWLQAAATALSAPIVALGHTVPPVYLSVGWPGGGNKRTRIGECWNGIASADGLGHIFVSPIVGSGLQVLGILAHELIHAVNHAAGETGHGKCFADIAKPIGLIGKMTETVAGPALEVRLLDLLTELGDYPHAALKPNANTKKQTTRMIKVECGCCGYVVRTTAKWLEVGLPSCPSGTLMVRSES